MRVLSRLNILRESHRRAGPERCFVRLSGALQDVSEVHSGLFEIMTVEVVIPEGFPQNPGVWGPAAPRNNSIRATDKEKMQMIEGSEL